MIDDKNISEKPQCRFFVVRKKRLCRMTVGPGKNYCGEHEPKPAGDDLADTRIPCPLDPKHTCYASKLEKHLSICNAKEENIPPYIVKYINVCTVSQEFIRRPLNETPMDKLLQLISKIELLYDNHVKENILTAPDRPIHYTLLEEFSATDRTESSLRHLRQASSLMHIIENEGFVLNKTCYVELGAGKGLLSYYAHKAWCTDNQSAVLLIDRASVRHKKDNKLKGERIARIRADLAHVVLTKITEIDECAQAVGFAKHLCGVATDYALRSMTSQMILPKSSGIAVCTCCHHRCEQKQFVGNQHLMNLGITPEELNIMLSLVSWATCGDGRSRERRNMLQPINDDDEFATKKSRQETQSAPDMNVHDNTNSAYRTETGNVSDSTDVHQVNLSQDVREKIGKKAKLLIDWGRVLFLKEKDFDAKLIYYVPSSVSLENVCILAKKC